ncbi:hypothetical protein TREMEDRAFT_61980 [Tremella mesenterica DSM 1558]|uniref:uncharacterized protein n=1 Tax=Tremella mesenterica (strain ATCC 24925 / CBS 8224 / DSM 1558 / NBRC 9311 / NRRL Y-6157 / RJB 2259-6 / UBC 559-6) TaxID=578456 RepID=UPI0003F48DA6|nr:uncharacterized protein TREMEDRAFT_61980 [Tremella mesenterica DSM 1558]EIW70218.1 hypothetical protein TREMEDRAFT_61980 [Tremella mesenterica DSM 1558]
MHGPLPGLIQVSHVSIDVRASFSGHSSYSPHSNSTISLPTPPSHKFANFLPTPQMNRGMTGRDSDHNEDSPPYKSDQSWSVLYGMEYLLKFHGLTDPSGLLRLHEEEQVSVAEIKTLNYPAQPTLGKQQLKKEGTKSSKDTTLTHKADAVGGKILEPSPESVPKWVEPIEYPIQMKAEAISIRSQIDTSSLDADIHQRLQNFLGTQWIRETAESGLRGSGDFPPQADLAEASTKLLQDVFMDFDESMRRPTILLNWAFPEASLLILAEASQKGLSHTRILTAHIPVDDPELASEILWYSMATHRVTEAHTASKHKPSLPEDSISMQWNQQILPRECKKQTVKGVTKHFQSLGTTRRTFELATQGGWYNTNTHWELCTNYPDVVSKAFKKAGVMYQGGGLPEEESKAISTEGYSKNQINTGKSEAMTSTVDQSSDKRAVEAPGVVRGGPTPSLTTGTEEGLKTDKKKKKKKKKKSTISLLESADSNAGHSVATSAPANSGQPKVRVCDSPNLSQHSAVRVSEARLWSELADELQGHPPQNYGKNENCGYIPANTFKVLSNAWDRETPDSAKANAILKEMLRLAAVCDTERDWRIATVTHLKPETKRSLKDQILRENDVGTVGLDFCDLEGP